MLTPAQANITVWRKGSFDIKLVFWKDEAKTEKYPISTYLVTFIVDGGLTLKEGEGLEVKNENEILIKMTPAQTAAAATLSRSHYHIELSASAGAEVLIPIRGTISFESP